MFGSHIFFFEDNIQRLSFYFGDLDLQCSAPEAGFPSCEIEKDSFRDSQGKQIRTEDEKSLESKVLKQKVTWSCSCLCRRGFLNYL